MSQQIYLKRHYHQIFSKQEPSIVVFVILQHNDVRSQVNQECSARYGLKFIIMYVFSWRLWLLWSCAPGLRIQQCQCQCVGCTSFSRLLDLKAEESRVVGHVKSPRCVEASRRPRALNRVRTQAIGALAQGSYPMSYPSARPRFVRKPEYKIQLSYAQN